MTAILFKIVSVFMSVIAFISGMFPALFDGKVYIDPNGDKVTIIENVDIGDDALVIKDYESFKALGDIGVSYDEEFFETNNLAIFTKEYHYQYDFHLVSVSIRDDKYVDVKYYIDHRDFIALFYSPTFRTVIIETSKNTLSISPSAVEQINFIKLYRDIFEN